MSDPHQALLDGLAELADLCPETELLLIGGLAVHLRLVGSRARPAQIFTAADLRRQLPDLVRVTADVDMCVAEADFALLDSRLRAHRFRVGRSAPPPHRYLRESLRLDLIAIPSAPTPAVITGRPGLGELVADLDSEFEILPGRGARIRVATPVALVILKCVAYDDHHESKHAIDIARLALVDVQTHRIRDALPAASRRLHRSVGEAMRRTRQAFADPDGVPAGCLLAMLSDGILRDEDDEWEDEELLRQDISQAVVKLLTLP